MGFSWEEAPAGGVRSVKKILIGGRQTYGKEEEERIMEIGQEEMGTKTRREEENEENETESVKRRCVASISVNASYIFSHGRRSGEWWSFLGVSFGQA